MAAVTVVWVWVMWRSVIAPAAAAALPRPNAPSATVNGQRYLTFTPWNGGWNNRRMSLEIAVVLAVATNRTLVLPPVSTAAQMHGELGYEDFFDLKRMEEQVNAQIDGFGGGRGVAAPLRVLTWGEFAPGAAAMAPVGPRIDHDCRGRTKNTANMCDRVKVLRDKGVPHLEWALKEGVVLPLATGVETEAFAGTAAYETFFQSRADVTRRMYAADLQPVVHFHKQLFGNFYQNVYFPDAAVRRLYYRIVRDAVAWAFHERLVAAASRAAAVDLQGDYDCLHIRRSDFARAGAAYQAQIFTADAIAQNVAPLLTSRRLYIASDEPAASSYWPQLQAAFPMKEVRHARSCDAFRGLRPIHVPIVEMLTCSRARTFVGTRMSTFTAFITRLRGYAPDVEDKGVYTTDTKYTEARPSLPVPDPYAGGKPWAREYPTAWDDIG
eukprot:TRINITY_DN12863_c0_g1_i1.p1 TRINITY_DN12863_c0_g1~~TRINITY_DN12863_c0_g1_i1.p1  ORF type:complete len:469 (+),score=143.76 TRINITY_DN12863_c0_g1_i1:96-1409(+)